MNNQFEAITFESIFVNAVKPAKYEVFVTLKVDLNHDDNCSTALIVQHGICKIPCEFQNCKSVAAFFITEADGPAIISLPTSLELDLVTLNCSVQKRLALDPQSIHFPVKPIKDKVDLTSQYHECFDGIGKLQG